MTGQQSGNRFNRYERSGGMNRRENMGDLNRFRQNQYARDPRQNYPNSRRWNNEGNNMGNR